MLLVKNYNMEIQNDTEKIMDVIKDYKNKSNKDLILAMDMIQKDFNYTKDTLIKLTHHLDSLELTYNNLLKEYKKRTNT
jgi:hypothetical protein